MPTELKVPTYLAVLVEISKSRVNLRRQGIALSVPTRERLSEIEWQQQVTPWKVSEKGG